MKSRFILFLLSIALTFATISPAHAFIPISAPFWVSDLLQSATANLKSARANLKSVNEMNVGFLAVARSASSPPQVRAREMFRQLSRAHALLIANGRFLPGPTFQYLYSELNFVEQKVATYRDTYPSTRSNLALNAAIRSVENLQAWIGWIKWAF